MDQAEGILIAPIWPTQVSWPQMLRLLIRHPVALPQQKSLLKLPNKKVHPLHAKMVLMACYISGNPMKQEEFWSQLATFSWPHGDLVPRKNIKSISRNGFTFVLKEKLIIINPLYSRLWISSHTFMNRASPTAPLTQQAVLYLPILH